MSVLEPRYISSLNITLIPNWAEQLANLTKQAWTQIDPVTQKDHCYFPYLPLTTSEYWKTIFLEGWKTGTIISGVFVSGDIIIAHSALMYDDFGKKGEKAWELGRWVSLRGHEHKGVMTKLVLKMVADARTAGISFRVEGTQAHTISQAICEKAGLRFAGFGILKPVEHIWWDIIYYDSGDPNQPFVPEAGVLANPLGYKMLMRESYRRRMIQIASIITTTPISPLPPQEFHILPRWEATVREIIELNT